MVLVILLLLAAVVIVLITALTIEIAWERGFDDGVKGLVRWPQSKWYHRGLVFGAVARFENKEDDNVG